MNERTEQTLRPFPRAEKFLIDNADEHLPTLALADQASDVLGLVLQAFNLPRRGVDDPGDGWFQTQALIYLGMLAGRSLRSLMALLRYGYDAEALVFKRRLSETLARVERIVDPGSGGQRARAWLSGKDKKPSSVVELPDGAWNYMSHIAHADFRAAEQHLVAPGDDGLSNFTLLPARDGRRANGLLVLAIMDVRLISDLIADFKGVSSGLPRGLDSDIVAASERYISKAERRPDPSP